MRVSLLQMTSSDDPEENLETLNALVVQARLEGADMALSPEVTNCISMDRAHQASVLHDESQDPFVTGVGDAARANGMWILAGSLAVKSAPPETRFANRSLLFDEQGRITARYDKMHMFDVQVTPEETFRESAGFAPGSQAVVADTPWARFGLTICYDLRFAYLFRALAQAGAQILTVPAAFSPGTGPAHWQPLLQARAIETGCFVLAPAQCGTHKTTSGKARRTHGHSLVVSPWGEVLLDAGTDPGVFTVDINLDDVAEARRKVPALTHDRTFEGPA